MSDAWLQHQVKARRWARVHPGVYATFTGELSWDARRWAALLRCGPGAVLAGSTALDAWEPGKPGVAAAARQGDAVVAVDERRRVRVGDELDVWRVSDLARHAHPARRPPCLRFEAAVLMTRLQGTDD